MNSVLHKRSFTIKIMQTGVGSWYIRDDIIYILLQAYSWVWH